MRQTLGLGLFIFTCLPAVVMAQSPSTLDKVKQSGSITVAYREASIPFSYLDDKAQPTGFGWEICGRIVDEVKKATGRADLKVATQAVTSANRIPLLVNGTIDIECGSTTNNSERGKQVAFAINYFYTGTRFLVKAGAPVKLPLAA
jgi:glutamate/aspartate transport system substrate-binding protein